MGGSLDSEVKSGQRESDLGEAVKRNLNIASLALVGAGLVFFLQGINILPGSYMTGDPRWAVIGGVMMVIGAALFFWRRRS